MTKPSDIITDLVNAGELDDTATTTKALIKSAGFVLDHSEVSDICGTVLFRAADKKWYVGSTEFVIAEANPDYVASEIYDTEHLECLVCGHIESEDSASFPAGPGNPAACQKCNGAMATITEERAKKLAQGTT